MAASVSEQQLLERVPQAIADLLGLPADEIDARQHEGSDLHVRAGGHYFLVELLAHASPGLLASHGAAATAAARMKGRKFVALLAVPFMSEAGRRVCEQQGIGWFDLSGNARIVAHGLRIIIDGKANQFRGPGRPASTFAPKSARVVRWLLVNQGRALTQREIARATDMTDGYVSRIVSRLERENYVVRMPNGALRARDPALLLDAWRSEYRFDKHELIQGHVAARSGDALSRFVAETLTASAVPYAATGLTAAWQMTHFAAFRIATFFLAAPLSKELQQKLTFREDPRGANLWLVIPNDAGVFQGGEVRDGIQCVHPVQAYVDLKGHPERANEAAERLRSDLLAWGRDA